MLTYENRQPEFENPQCDNRCRRICEILHKLKAYEEDSTAKFVILKGNGKAFCAGGDVTAAINMIISGHWSFGGRFYRRQYALDYLLATYKKPLVALINGIVMGGGAGISMHATFRLVTEKTVFAMPEAAIGLIPDVGASHFLSRLPGFFGEYLGLTGARLDGNEMVTCGLATHFVHSKDLASLEHALDVEGSSKALDVPAISNIINKFGQKVSIKKDSPYNRLEIINDCFCRETVEEIVSKLEGYLATNNSEKWITGAIKFMKAASPTSLKVFLKSIRKGRKQILPRCLVQEYNVLCHMLRRTFHDDVFEGSRAMLIDKDKRPKWKPSKLELVSEEMVDGFFDKVDDEEWEPLQLPHRSIAAYTTQNSKL
ncbi:probable 3-hydroxyisobutyryl-CoA hydrolase 3 [Diospyros lotus]|uniref:probable 3-hydroxyisobutyryl-CoA hydrolase 3 n=1 Tax=Diospyros lotus TaxID=55363 RepID=UPI00224DC8E8|nr:probable 3-hydroxyisobutyryl-CoA hydrolase 3 [Diospyros lotus]